MNLVNTIKLNTGPGMELHQNPQWTPKKTQQKDAKGIYNSDSSKGTKGFDPFLWVGS